MHIPIDKNIINLDELPYTISFVIRKRQQLDSLSEFPKDKRPPEMMIWTGSSDDIENWIDKVYDLKKQKESDTVELVIESIEE